MATITVTKKSKINLNDYNYQKDILNRRFLTDLSAFDLQVLDAILYSSIKIAKKILAKMLNIEIDDLGPVLDFLKKTGLLSKIQGDTIIIDKQMRKTYEALIEIFDESFKPDMHYLQKLLKKVPIHILPQWYSISRTSNNIFESIIEKYLLTPQLFYRHLQELQSSDPLISSIIEDVYESPSLFVFTKTIQEKYDLDEEELEKIILLLEFQFALCLCYRKIEGKWHAILTPFYEWKEYLFYLRKNTLQSLNVADIQLKRSRPFAFIEDMNLLLQLASQQPLLLFSSADDSEVSSTCIAQIMKLLKDADHEEFTSTQQYFTSLIEKLMLLKLVKRKEKHVHVLPKAKAWLEHPIEKQALILYRHKSLQISEEQIPAHLLNERIIKEAEKTILSALNKHWVFFDELMQNPTIPLQETQAIKLTCFGTLWKYVFPEYTSQEKSLIHRVIFQRLFTIGVTQTGTYKGQDCFCVTPFGHKIFEQ